MQWYQRRVLFLNFSPFFSLLLSLFFPFHFPQPIIAPPLPQYSPLSLLSFISLLISSLFPFSSTFLFFPFLPPFFFHFPFYSSPFPSFLPPFILVFSEIYTP